VLNSSLVKYCRSLEKPLVIFFDEADCLANGTLIAFLRQLRSGYTSRARVPFVHSVALVGMRDLGDYKAQARLGSETLGGMSPFNIVTKSFNLRNFNKAETAELYTQHTAETGQVFEPEMTDYAFEQTQGQPWLVNAIARECVEMTRKDYSIPITRKMAELAVQNIVLDRRTHITSMAERLKEPRVRKVIEPLISGDVSVSRTTDDYQYVKDMGLIRDDDNNIRPSNPIYAELIIRTLSLDAQDSIREAHRDYEPLRYMKDGKLDMDFLLRDFQSYWRENSEIWINRYKTELYEYDEAAPHLVMQAFLHRVVNSGGHIIREMALGTKRVDLCVVYENHKYPIELKILQNIRNHTESLEQIIDYMDKTGSNTGWLVIFDRDSEKSWDEKIYMREENVNGKRIVISGC
jgi:hypothetical protein